MAAMEQKRYSYTSKIATLRLLEQNEYSFLKTEKVTGIRRQTIKVWANKFGADVFTGNSPFDQALEEVERELKQNNLKTIHACGRAMHEAIEKISELAKTENNILKLCRAIKLLHDMTNELDESGARSLKHPYS
jgi:hypothetical protein